MHKLALGIIDSFLLLLLPQRVVRVKKMDEGEEEGAELTTDEIEALSQRMYKYINTQF